jgi:hypothetical protein
MSDAFYGGMFGVFGGLVASGVAIFAWTMHRDVDSDWNPARVKLTFDFMVKMDKQIGELGSDVFRNYKASKAKLKCWSAKALCCLSLVWGVGHKFATQSGAAAKFWVVSSISVRMWMSLFILVSLLISLLVSLLVPIL